MWKLALFSWKLMGMWKWCLIYFNFLLKDSCGNWKLQLVNVCVRWIRVGPTHGTSVVTKMGWQNGLYDCGPETTAFQSHFQCLLHRLLLGSKNIYVFVGPPYNLARYPLHVGASDSACSSNSDCHSSSFEAFRSSIRC